MATSPSKAHGSLTGGEALVQALKSFGVDRVFGAGGFTEMQDALIDHKEIAFHLSLHEAVSVSMAEGYSLATGKPAVTTLHVAVGLANAMGGLFSAFRDEAPVVAIAGERSTKIAGRRSYNESPAMAEMPRQFAKQSRQILRADRIAEDVSRAVGLALSPPAGPVFIAIPLDFFEEEVSSPQEFPAAGPEAFPRSFRGDPDLISKTARFLSEAVRPIIIAGKGVGKSRASAELFTLAEAIGAPVFLEQNSYFVDLPTGHPLYWGEFDSSFPAVKEADLVLSVGGRVSIEMEYAGKRILPSGSRLVQISDNDGELSLVSPADLGVLSDSKLALGDIAAALGGRGREKGRDSVSSRIESLKDARAKFERALQRLVEGDVAEENLVSFGRFASELAARSDPKGTVLIGHTSGVSLARRVLKPHTLFFQTGSGYQGWLMGASLGVKLGMPEEQVICMLGDGNVMFGPQALWSAARYKIGVKVVVVNNGFYRSEITKKSISTGNYMGSDLGSPAIDFAALARSMGVASRTVAGDAEIHAAIDDAFASKDPFLIDVRVGKENPNALIKEAIKAMS